MYTIAEQSKCQRSHRLALKTKAFHTAVHVVSGGETNRLYWFDFEEKSALRVNNNRQAKNAFNTIKCQHRAQIIQI